MPKNNKEKIALFAAGGTGGHISPAVSVAEELTKQNPAISILFFTLARNQNSYDIVKIAKNPKVKVIFYKETRISKSFIVFLRFIRNLIANFFIIQKNVKNTKVLFSVGFGGYPSFPVVLWAFVSRNPYFLCEQNKVYSRVNSLMARFAKKVYVSFPKNQYKKNELYTGNPLRSIFHTKTSTLHNSINSTKKVTQAGENPKKTYSTSIKKILILGGSQGSIHLNELYLLAAQDGFFQDIQFVISTGKLHYDSIKGKGREQDTIVAFIEDMPQTLLETDVIISRSGSSSVFEIHWSKKPVVFVPFAFAIRNHQYHNASFLEENNVAKIIDIRPFNAQAVLLQLKKTLQSNFYDAAIQNYRQNPNGFLLMNAEKRIVSDINQNVLSN